MGNSCSSKNKITPAQSSTEEATTQNNSQGLEWMDKARQKCIERYAPKPEPATSSQILEIRSTLKITTEMDRNKSR